MLHKLLDPPGQAVVMVTCNKIPLAQHGRRETRLKLNTITLREALLAHTNSRGTKQTNRTGALRAVVSQVSFSLKGGDIL